MTSTLDDITTGQRIAELRRKRGLSQRDLAQEVQRSESWVSQVERGIQPLERLSVLQVLADALGVSVRELRPDIQTDDESTPERANDLDGLRVALAGHPALADLVQTADETASLSELQEAVDEAWDLAHASRFSELSRLLTRLLPQLELAAHRAGWLGVDNNELHRLLAKAYQAAAAAFARQDEADAAWLASDRAITAAARSGNELEVIAGGFRMAHAFLRLARFDQAERVTSLAIEALRPRAAEPDCPPEALSLLGAMHLVQATISAREGDRAYAHRQLQAARRIAKRVGTDRNDFDTEFGPTNTELHAVAAAADLGDAGEALELASQIDASGLSNERHARFLLDVARAHAQRRHVGEATAALLDAERLAPEQVRTHHLMRETVRDLLQLAGPRSTDELRQLAERSAVMP